MSLSLSRGHVCKKRFEVAGTDAWLLELYKMGPGASLVLLR